MTEQQKREWIKDLAERLYLYVDPWDREWASPAEIGDNLENNPLGVVDYLLSQLEEA